MSKITSNRDNFLQFICFFIDVGTETVLKVFYYLQSKNPSIVTFPISRTSHIAKQLQKVLFKAQYYNVTNASVPDNFDLSILITLLSTLFSGILRTPVNGWGGKPAPGDHSISADLLRLRSIRNDIVAHTNRANLSSTDFDELWKTVEEILKRLVHTVDPGNEEKLEETFETYRHINIGASSAEKYVEILKKQLEELNQTVHDFILLWKHKQKTPFMRYIRLLLNGGRSLLTAYLNKLVKEKNASLQSILLEKQALVLEKLNGNQAMIEEVYPRVEDDVKTVNTETTVWDISVLANVIESLSTTSVDKYDLDAIRAVREARENYAYTALHAIASEEETFHAECEDILLHLSHLARSNGDTSIQEFNRFKHEYRYPSSKMTSEDVDKYLNQLKRPGLDIKDITDIHKECVGKLRTELSTKGQINVNVNENFELEIMIQLACQDIEKQEEAESTLYKFMKAIIADPQGKTEEGPDLPEVRQTLDTIRNIPSVKLTCVKKSCILLTVQSNSSEGLMTLVDFVDSLKFQNQLDGISTELKDMFDEVFLLKGHFTLDSIQKTLVRIKENAAPVMMISEFIEFVELNPDSGYSTRHTSPDYGESLGSPTIIIVSSPFIEEKKEHTETDQDCQEVKQNIGIDETALKEEEQDPQNVLLKKASDELKKELGREMEITRLEKEKIKLDKASEIIERKLAELKLESSDGKYSSK